MGICYFLCYLSTATVAGIIDTVTCAGCTIIGVGDCVCVGCCGGDCIIIVIFICCIIGVGVGLFHSWAVCVRGGYRHIGRRRSNS